MEPAAIEEMYHIEDHHWWFVGKRLLIGSLLRDVLPSEGGRILDVGCGTGAVLSQLQGNVAGGAFHVGTDRSLQALGFCSRRGLRRFVCADIARLPFKPEAFDVVLLLDVLEHVSDENALLQAVRALLRPGGTALISVPAYQFLWSTHDEALHHFRRYTATRLRRVLNCASFTIAKLTYTNVAPLLPALIVRGLLPRLGFGTPQGTDFRVHGRILNRLLIAAYEVEAGFIRRMRFPCGLSVAAVVRKTGA